MSNPHRGEVDLQVGGKTYTIVLDINAICELEQLLGKSVAEIGRDMGRILNMRAMLWAGLRARHQVTLEEVGEILQQAGMQQAVVKIKEAMALAFPPDNGKGVARNPH